MNVIPTVSPRSRVAVPVAWTTAAIVAVALLGQWTTDLGPWYQALKQPWWKPPDLAFGPAWTLIYLLTGTAIVRTWLAMEGPGGRRARRRFLAAAGLNAALNVLWSWLFFRLRRPDWALAEVGLLWLSVLLLAVLAARHSSGAAWLFAPYAAWVAFAATLNAGVVRLNGPF